MQLKIFFRLLCLWGKRTSRKVFSSSLNEEQTHRRRSCDNNATIYTQRGETRERHFPVTSDVVVHRLDLRSSSLIRDVLVLLRIGSSSGYRYFFLVFPYKSFVRYPWLLSLDSAITFMVVSPLRIRARALIWVILFHLLALPELFIAWDLYMGWD